MFFAKNMMMCKMFKSQMKKMMRHSFIFLFFITLIVSFSRSSAAPVPDETGETAAQDIKKNSTRVIL